MIDARDYDTHEELKEAMENEGNIVKKQSLDWKIQQYRMAIFQAEYAIEILTAQSDVLKRKIMDYNAKQRKKKEDAYSDST